MKIKKLIARALLTAMTISAIHAPMTVQAASPLTSEEEAFFGSLNLTLPGLESVQEAVNSKDAELAKKELLDYYTEKF